MTLPESAEVIQQAARVGVYGGGGTAVFFGFSPGEWQVIGVVGGIGVGLLGVFVSALINVYFKHQHLKLAMAKAKADEEE